MNQERVEKRKAKLIIGTKDKKTPENSIIIGIIGTKFPS